MRIAGWCLLGCALALVAAPGRSVAADATPIVAAALERGLLVNRTSVTVVRLLPAYIVSEADIDEAVAILDQVFSEGART